MTAVMAQMAFVSTGNGGEQRGILFRAGVRIVIGGQQQHTGLSDQGRGIFGRDHGGAIIKMRRHHRDQPLNALINTSEQQPHLRAHAVTGNGEPAEIEFRLQRQFVEQLAQIHNRAMHHLLIPAFVTVDMQIPHDVVDLVRRILAAVGVAVVDADHGIARRDRQRPNLMGFGNGWPAFVIGVPPALRAVAHR